MDYGYEIVTQTITCTEGTEVTITAAAPAGKVVVGGGWLSHYPADHITIGDSYPVPGGTGWAVRVKLLGNTGNGFSANVTAYAVCVDAS